MSEDSNPQIRPKLEMILYGASYYHEYMPCERLVQYIALMKDADFTEGSSLTKRRLVN